MNPAAPTLLNEVRRHLHELLISQAIQPGAAELLERLEEQFGWPARHVMAEAFAALRDDKALPGYQRDYLRITLSDASLSEALRGGVKKNYEDTATLDRLFQRSAAYRDSDAFRGMIEFTAKFREYAPYNNMLVKLQNPACSFYATERDWRDRFGRHLIEDARRDRIRVDLVRLSTTLSGLATTRVRGADWKMRIQVHDGLSPASQFSVLCHELAHIYCGHLGGDTDNWWPARMNLNHATVEIEAEAVAYIVSQRLDLRPVSESYLCAYLPPGGVPKTVSMELISKVAGKLLTMTERPLPPRKKPGSRESIT